MKRVWNLYRVSTDRQTDGDDIPVQKNACREFIDKRDDWNLTRELLELGVSGFKKKASERDAIDILRKGAVNKEFDIILVYMYDRLGRKHEETPFIVEWLVKQGVEVWSVSEGQRTFDNHVDSLTNYITFWQASGESIKTSIRVTEAISQLNEEGRYMGGTAPYGYEIYDTDIRHEKKDKFIKAIRINKQEAEVVTIIFDLALNKGYGASRIAGWLSEHGYKTRTGSGWRHNYISRILRNPIVIGFKRFGYNDEGVVNWEEMKLQPHNPDLIIIKETIFKIVQDMITSRHNKQTREGDDSIIPRKSRLLLSGIATCGYCGSNLCADYAVKSHKRKDGVVTKTHSTRYVCKRGKGKHKGGDGVVYHGVSQFGSKKYEEEVVRIVKEFIGRTDKTDFTEKVRTRKLSFLDINKTQVITLQKSIEEDYKELSAVKGLLIKVEMGLSRLSFETVEEMLLTKETSIAEKSKSLILLEKKIEEASVEAIKYELILDEINDWEQRYDSVDLDGKKMMLSRIISSLEIRKDEIDIKLDLLLEKEIVSIRDPNEEVARFNKDLVVGLLPSTNRYGGLDAPQFLQDSAIVEVGSKIEWLSDHIPSDGRHVG